MSAFELAPSYVQWRVAIALHVGYVGAYVPQGVHESLDGALLHALRAGDGVLAGCGCQVCRHEAHGRAGGLYVYYGRHAFQCVEYYFRVVTVRQVVGLYRVAGQCVDY